jgi:hypothetical protein
VFGWIAAIGLLQSSPVLNGYHFVPYGYIPVALLAADPVSRTFERLRAGASAAAGALALAALLFAGTAANAAGAFEEVAGLQLPADYAAALASLAALPPGNVLCESGVGNAVPAFGPHRVFVGHWFMTPDREGRAELAGRALGPGGGALARQLVESERIDYVLAVTPAVPSLAAALADLAPRVETHGEVSILALRGR